MHTIQRFFVRTTAFAAFFATLGMAAGVDDAKAVTAKMDTAIGEINLAVDTIMSVGVAVRTKSRDQAWISSANGGFDYVRDLPACGATNFGQVGCLVTLPQATDPLATGVPRIARFKNADDKNFAGNQNQDDGHLNFDKGDLTALTLKILTDMQADLSTRLGDFTVFARIQAYADPVLRDGSFYERVGPDDAAKRELGRDIKILDGYFSWDGDIPLGSFIGELPFNLRVGKLTANNWGESTFALNGIAASIVIDVPSARRAGAEIREIIQPEYMVYGSIGLPFDIGLDAYYQFHHSIWNLDVGGSPTATNDISNPGSPQGGFLWLTGSSTTSSTRRNCELAGDDAFSAVAPSQIDCLENSDVTRLSTPVHYANPFYEFDRLTAEQWRLQLGELNTSRVNFTSADDQGQWGVQLSYYVDSLYILPPMGAMMGGFMEDGFALPGIEFNFSYQNVHARVPYVQYKSAGRPTITLAVQDGTSPATTQALTGLGCAGGGATLASLDLANPPPGITATQIGGAMLARGTLGAIAMLQGNDGYEIDPRHFPGGIEGVQQFARVRSGDDTLVVANNALSLFDAVCAVYDNIRVTPDELRPMLATNTPAGGLPSVGSENITLQGNIELDFYYPENIKVIGFSFNTTIPWLEWGLQSEFSWRPNQPVQVDVTEQIIAVYWSQCIHWGLGPVAVALNGMATQGNCTTANVSNVALLATDPDSAYQPVSHLELDMFNYIVGTTALYNNSNPVVGFLRADQAVVLVEYNLVAFSGVPSAASARGAANLQGPSLHCITRSGTELPLGGILGLDGLGNQECTPDEVSMGYTVLAFMDYNNVFGTAWRLRPQMAVRHGVRGNTPSPVNSWREDTLTVNWSLQANFQNTWTMTAGYVAFFDVGSGDYNANSGNDAFSFNISYAF